MGGFSLTLSLRKDELDAIENRMKELGLNRHQTIKLALRRYFFPSETSIPVNGKSVEVHKISAHGANVTHLYVKNEPAVNLE